MKIKLIYGLIACLWLVSCDKKEDRVEPSNADKNWFEIKDNPSDELDHLIYQVYKETGVSILYNDTLGYETRYDGYGNPYLRYEKIRLGYALMYSAPGTQKYKLATDRQGVLEMVQLINDYVLPVMPPVALPMSYLVVGELTETQQGATVSIPVYRDITTTLVRIDTVERMSEGEKVIAAAKIIGGGVYSYLVRYLTAKELNEFYDITNFLTVPGLSDNVPGSGAKYPRYATASYQVSKGVSPNPETYGFLYWFSVTSTTYRSIREIDDFMSYIALFFSTEEAEVQERYKNFPVVLKKYEVVKKMIEKVVISI